MINKDFSISFNRVIAMFMIIAAHFMGKHEYNAIAEFFELGVFIFFFISGYLYGTKNISNLNTWIIRRLIRIFIPLYIYLIIFYSLNGFTNDFYSLLMQLLNLQGLFYFSPVFVFVNGPWFFTVIMFCYFLVYIVKKNCFSFEKLSYPFFVTINIIIFILFKLLDINIIGIEVFFIGYFFSNNKIFEKQKSIYINIIFFFISIFVRLIAHKLIYNEFLYKDIIVPILNTITSIYMISIIKYIYNKSNLIKLIVSSSYFDLIDKSSIYVYLIHGFIIDLLFVETSNIFVLILNYFSISLISMLLSYILYVLNQKIENKINKIINI